MREIKSDLKFILNPQNNPIPGNWHAVEKLINHHRLFHHLEDIFKLHGEDIPPEIKSRLKKNTIYELQRQYQLAQELVELCRKFDAEDLKYVCLKGPALAIQLYGSIHARVSRDLDFLIGEEDIPEFISILSNSGYRIKDSEKAIEPVIYRKLKKDQGLLNPEKRILVELHWRLFTHKRFFPGTHRLMEEPEQVPVLEYPVPVMNRSNHLLYLSMHGIYHEFFRLFWLRDIAEAEMRWQEDKEGMWKLAREMKIERVIAAAIFLAKRIFLPHYIHSDEVIVGKAGKIADHCIKVINRSSPMDKVDRFQRIFYFMALKKGILYKLECVTGAVKRFFRVTIQA